MILHFNPFPPITSHNSFPCSSNMHSLSCPLRAFQQPTMCVCVCPDFSTTGSASSFASGLFTNILALSFGTQVGLYYLAIWVFGMALFLLTNCRRMWHSPLMEGNFKNRCVLQTLCFHNSHVPGNGYFIGLRPHGESESKKTVFAALTYWNVKLVSTAHLAHLGCDRPSAPYTSQDYIYP